MSSGLISEVRSLDDLKGNFAISDAIEYLSAPSSEDLQTATATVIIYSNAFPLVERHRYFFKKLWGSAKPALERAKEIEEGIQEPTIALIRDLEETRTLFSRLLEQAKEEILLILPTANEFHRKEKFGFIDSYESRRARSEGQHPLSNR